MNENSGISPPPVADWNFDGQPSSNMSQEFDDLVNLHSAVNRFNNYTMEARSCEGNEINIYSVVTRYKRFHGYIALAVCMFGAIANCLLMVVLRRKEMRSPVNLMLFALAIADLLIMIEYIPFALHMYVLDQELEDKHSRPSAIFIFFHVHFTQILHTISIQLTLTMAVWRYAAMKLSTRSSIYCTVQRCYQVIAAAYICPLFFCILNYLYFQIMPRTKYLTYGPRPFDEIDGGDTEKLQIFKIVCKLFHIHDCSIKKVELYTVESSDLVKEFPVLHTIHFWTFSVLIKLVPCVVLTFFMCWMINTLYQARRHHRMLEEKSAQSHPLTQSTSTAIQRQSIAEVTAANTKKNSVTNNNQKLPSPSRGVRFTPASTTVEAAEGGLNGNVGGEVVSVREEDRNSVCGNGNGKKEVNGTLNGTGDGDILPRSPSHDEPERRRSSTVSFTGNFTRGLIRLASIRSQGGEGRLKGVKLTDRTSKMLIAVLVLFLLTEFPQGIMHFLTGWYGPEFLRCKYNPWAEIWDLLALINSAINFILYCFMSKQFRTQFQISFKLDRCWRWPRWTICSKGSDTATV